ncbi:GNAT family N-acetyltransferase [Variovorax ginsengisoli]|uniref:GNAT superfamily N-acetyltransferase n=1 Tax=Variovorax ginsengisoli TaxID=363844 RepID=A0ABT9SF02_9BURK|nr:GNAT family N-acetyltransferase [Variovorax ginsengisoli]MDP9902949.1 GNAT superfamily N-acetyltransferase [Variovorax ginsengisoli]
MNPTVSSESMRIRNATLDDAPAVSALILSLAHHFLLRDDGSGAEGFLLSLEPEGIARNIGAPELDYYVGTAAGQLMGVVAVRDRTHLFHLFVGQPFQRGGVARALWSHVKKGYGWPSASVATTVNSTPSAVSFMSAWGFTRSGARVETKGIAYVPMRLAQNEPF